MLNVSHILDLPVLSNYWLSVDGASQRSLLGNNGTNSDYSTTVVRSHPTQATNTMPPSLSSILTIRSPQPTETGQEIMPPSATVNSIESFHTASSSISIAAATEGSSFDISTIRGSPSTLIHRFTLIKPGVKRHGHPQGPRVGSPAKGEREEPSSPGDGQLRSPFGFFFSSAIAAKCDLCAKRLGWKPVLECDDCGLRRVSE